MSQRKITWFAIVFSTFIYAAILWSLSRNWPQPGPFEEAVQRPMVLGLYAVAVFDFALAFILPRVISHHRSRFIVTLSLFEACAIFGLMAAFINQDWRLFIGPWVLALIGFMRNYPGD